MPKLVEKSLDRVVEISIDREDCIKDESEREVSHYCDNKKRYRTNYGIEELMGCYIDRSNQNCSLSKDNNIIYLCRENIEKFASIFDGFNYNLVKNNIMEELWDLDGI